MSTSLHSFLTSRRPGWAMVFCAAAVWAGGCAQVLPPPEVFRAAIANPELSLHLVDGDSGDKWRVFDVRYATFGRRLLLREEAAEGAPVREPLVVHWKGSAWAWPDLATLWIDQDIYDKRRHSAKYRMRHPWSGENWILAARGVSHRVRSISLPVREKQAPHLTFFGPGDGDDDEPSPLGELNYDEASRRLLFGQLGTQDVEIERVDVLAFDREPGILQHLVGSYPSSGEYVIRIDGQETARFLREGHGGETGPTYRLAIRTDLGEADRDRSLWLFFGFDRMMAFLRSTK